MRGENSVDILDQSLALELFTQGITRRVDLFVRGWTSARWSARTSGSWSDILRMIQRRVQDLDHIIIAQARHKQIEVVHLGNLLDEFCSVFTKRPVIQVIQNVEVDSMSSTCEECRAIVATAQSQYGNSPRQSDSR